MVPAARQRPEPPESGDGAQGVADLSGEHSEQHRHRWLDHTVVVLMGVAAVLAALVEVMLIPTYWGTTPLGVSIVLAIGLNVLMPWVAHSLVRTTAAAMLPALSWLVALLLLVTLPGSNGDVFAPGGDLAWVTYAVMFGGAIAAAATVVRITRP